MKLFIYLFLILHILIIKFINCQITFSQPIENIVNKYPPLSNSNVCDYEFVVTAIAPNAFNIELSANNSYVAYQFEYKSQNLTHLTITTTFVLSGVPIISDLFNFTSKVNGIDADNYQFAYSCVLFDSSKLGFAAHALMTSARPYLNFQFEAIIQGIGILYNQPILVATFQTSGNIVDIVSIGNGYYGFNQPLDVIGGRMPSSTDILLHFANSITLTLTIGNSFDGIYKSPANFFTFPSKLTQVTEFGYKCSPLVQIINNQTDNYFNPLDFIDTLSNIPTPIYGIGNEITLMVNLPDTNSDGINTETFTLYGYNLGNPLITFDSNITTKKISEFQVIGTSSSVLRSNYFVANFSNNLKYEFNDFELGLGENFGISSWPFGFISTAPNGFTFKHSFPINPHLASTPSFIIKPHLAQTYINISIDFTPQVPVYLISGTYDITYLYDFNFLVTIGAVSPNALDYIDIDGVKYRGDNITSTGLDEESNVVTTFSLIVDMLKVPFNTISIVDEIASWTTFKVGRFFNTFSYVYRPKLLDNLDIFKITSVSYKYSNVVMVPDKPFSNVLYFNFSGISVDTNRPFGLLLMDRVSFNPATTDFNSYQFISNYNNATKLFEIPFIIPANTMNGVLPWSLKYGCNLSYNSTNLNSGNQLMVTSTKFDAYGPIIDQIMTIITLDDLVLIGFNITIRDDHNGFKYGDFVLRGELDYSLFKFHITPADLISGDSKLGSYNIKISLPINGECLAQKYIITEVTLVDNGGNIGRFSTVNEIDPISNVFINFMDFPNFNKVDSTTICRITPDTTPPVLTSFKLVSYVKRIATYNFSAIDNESGLRNDQLPIVYLTANNFQTIQCTSKIISNDSNSANYECSITVPNGFGYPNILLPSVHGLINNAGYGQGFSYEQLFGVSGIQSSIDFNLIEITGSSEFNSYGGQLWIKGRGFKQTQKVYIDYNYGVSVFNEIAFSLVYPNAFKIDTVQRTNFSIYVYVQDGSEISNTFKITPIIFEPKNLPPPFFVITPKPTSSSSLDSSSSNTKPTPTPSTPPTIPRCLGTPECGGINQGYCNVGKCVCYSPYIGNDCSSKVIIIPKPTINTTDPTIEIPIGGGDNGDNSNSETLSTDKILYKSLISLVSIRELDFNSQKVVEYPLEKWIYHEINSTTNEYITNITVKDTDNPTTSTTTTTVKATLQWFSDATNITFANQQLSMNPSSIKYTIELTNYKFKTDLNTLQLIMSASFSASKSNDICSVKEFGTITEGDNNSNYIKVQIGDHSLFGRYIKRGIVDDNMDTIDNVLLDGSLNTINSASSVQSFIGINIPNYKKSILIDPDFSVLLDSNNASNNDNSICSTSSSSKLSTSQLAGIIVGSVAFVAVASIATGYYIIKKKKHSKFMLNIHNKLKTMN